jgi:hypothetical protein
MENGLPLMIAGTFCLTTTWANMNRNKEER